MLKALIILIVISLTAGLGLVAILLLKLIAQSIRSIFKNDSQVREDGFLQEYRQRNR